MADHLSSTSSPLASAAAEKRGAPKSRRPKKGVFAALQRLNQPAPPPTPPPRLGELPDGHYVSTEDLVAITGLSRSFFDKLRWRGGGPPYVRISARRICYRVGDVRAWLGTRIRTQTSEDSAA